MPRQDAADDQEELRLVATAFKLLGSGWQAFPHQPSDSPAVEVKTPDGKHMLVSPLLKAQGGPGWSAYLFLSEIGRLGDATHKLPDQKHVSIPLAVAHFADAYGAGQLVDLQQK